MLWSNRARLVCRAPDLFLTVKAKCGVKTLLWKLRAIIPMVCSSGNKIRRFWIGLPIQNDACKEKQIPFGNDKRKHKQWWVDVAASNEHAA